jgi:UDP-N-acetylmuramoyl-tripeptide--D-alanyl-D-alanine ligase
VTAAADPVHLALGELAQAAGGTLRLPPGGGRDVLTTAGFAIDTRSLRGGEVFVPLPGSRAVGHDFLAEAFARGAAAALCSRDRAVGLAGREPGPLVVVEDVTAALQALARRHRGRWAGLLVGVTGSAGKTTTKDLVALALGSDRPTLKTEGNLNNHWGVPLTLLRLGPEDRAAVVEMGANHPGEIALLASLARPDAAIITNVGAAHLEGFGSVEAVAREKAALASAVPPGHPVFAGADSAPLERVLAGAPQRVILFGVSTRAAVRPERVEDLGPAGLRIEVAGFPPCRLTLVGRHQALNALAAFAVAREYRLEPGGVVSALESYRSPKGRMEVREVRGATVLVDCYNANPESTRAALGVLAGWPGARRRVAVLGDMLELGRQAARLHAETGAAVREAELWAVGEHAAAYAEGARRTALATRVFADLPAVAAALGEALEPGVVVLLKASRGVALERVLEGLGGGG